MRYLNIIKQFGKPQKVITDQAPSTKVAMAKVIKAFKLKPDTIVIEISE